MIAVVLLAYGGPDSLDDVPAYLHDIRGGRETPQALIDEITERYRQIGGRSPLLAITRRAAANLQAATGLPAYVGMRHWHPYIKDVVAQMAADGVDQIVAICMAPHYSALSVGAYRARLEEAVAATGKAITVCFVESWHTEPAHLEGVAASIRTAVQHFPEATRDDVKVIFTAHSLPAFILERGDPYDAQLRETARLLAARLKLADDRWTFCYQSAPQGGAQAGVPWLGPQIEQVVAALGAQGEKNLIVAPIGFIADHVEVLYDIDIGVQEIARARGVRVERPPMLNDSAPLVAALAQITSRTLEDLRLTERLR
ncbi:MAG: ferrochelatase [Anaerolineae bacterium]|nr:ferrochelatase [Anaerolineae bacterium]